MSQGRKLAKQKEFKSQTNVKINLNFEILRSLSASQDRNS